MKVSARNQLPGEVRELKQGAVNTEVVIGLPGGQQIVSMITNTSAEALGLEEGRPAYAIIKASSVILHDDFLRTSARNNLCGEIIRCERGAVNTEVVLEVGGDTRVTAVITNDSADELALAEGRRACAMIKASSVIIGVD